MLQAVVFSVKAKVSFLLIQLLRKHSKNAKKKSLKASDPPLTLYGAYYIITFLSHRLLPPHRSRCFKNTDFPAFFLTCSFLSERSRNVFHAVFSNHLDFAGPAFHADITVSIPRLLFCKTIEPLSYVAVKPTRTWSFVSPVFPLF